MDKILVILGPTATGKTDLGLHLAKKLSGELVACDSRQVYKGLDIGTGKESSDRKIVRKGRGFWEIGGIRVWMYDVCSPNKQYNAALYFRDAGMVIREIIERGKLPIIVGGSGLYLKALLYGISNLSIPQSSIVRDNLSKLSLNSLQKKLKKISCIRWKKLNESDRKNPRRLIRAIELKVMKKYEGKKNFDGLSKKDNILKIGLGVPRSTLKEKIYNRVVKRINQGMINEAYDLNKKGLSLKRMKELGLEYGILAQFLEGELNKEQLTTQLQIKIHQYAKRQMTWFKKEKDILWVDITTQRWREKIDKIVNDWYNRESQNSKVKSQNYV